MPKIIEYQVVRYIGDAAYKTSLGTVGISAGSQFTEVDGNGNIVDFWVFDGTRWNH